MTRGVCPNRRGHLPHQLRRLFGCKVGEEGFDVRRCFFVGVGVVDRVASARMQSSEAAVTPCHRTCETDDKHLARRFEHEETSLRIVTPTDVYCVDYW